MTFTATKHLRTCRDCGREFIVSHEAIEFAMQDSDLATEEEAVEEIDLCLECVIGEPCPEERPAPESA